MTENETRKNGETEAVEKKQKEYMTNQQKFALWMMLMVLGIAIAFVIALIIISGRSSAAPVPDIIINNDIILPDPSPTAEPQAYNMQPIEADLLTVDIPLLEMPELPQVIFDMELTATAVPAVPEDEIIALAKTLKGECYDREYDDMRRVAWTVVNRVDSPAWCNDVISVITRPGQFHGYRPGNVPTDDNFAIAEEVLTAWYSGDYSGREALFGDMIAIYFYSRSGETVNIFREG